MLCWMKRITSVSFTIYMLSTTETMSTRTTAFATYPLPAENRWWSFMRSVLWQGTFRKILISRDAHFLHVPYYIHLNPLDLAVPEWRTGKVKNESEVFDYLNTYRWSSYLDYSGVKNFPSIIDQDLLSDTLGSAAKQRQVIKDIVTHAELATRASKLE